MALPILVMVKVPCASGVQEAEIEMVGGAVVGEGVKVGVAVGDWQKVEDVAVPMLPPPDASSSKVPNSPEVLTWVDAPAVSWKLWVAMGVPLSSKVQVPGPVISTPEFVIVKVPCASGVQEAEIDMTGTAACASGAACTFAGDIAFACTSGAGCACAGDTACACAGEAAWIDWGNTPLIASPTTSRKIKAKRTSCIFHGLFMPLSNKQPFIETTLSRAPRPGRIRADMRLAIN